MGTTARKRGRPAESSGSSEPKTDELQQLITRLGGEAGYIRLYRMTSGRKVFITRTGLQPSQEEVQRDYGGGEYVLEVCENGGTIRGVTRWLIDGPPIDRSNPSRVEQQPNPEREPPATMAEAVFQMRELVREMRNPPPAAQQGNPLAMAAELLTAGAAIITPFLEHSRERERDRAPRGESGMGITEAMELYREGVRMGRSLATNGRPNGPLDEITGPLGSLLTKLAGSDEPAPPRAALPSPARTNPPSPGTPVSTTHATGAPTWRDAMNKYFTTLNSYAEGNLDPVTYADFAYDQLPESVVDGFLEDVRRGEDFRREFFEQLYPAAQPYRMWWDAFFARVLEIDQHVSGVEVLPAEPEAASS